MAELLPGYIAGTFPANAYRMINGAAFMRSGAAGVSGQVQARSGVLGYKSLKVAASSGLTVSVASGAGVLQGSGATQGPYVLVNNADDTITLNTANATLARKDAVVARVYDLTDGVGGNGNQWIIDKVTGTPAASPVLPSIPTDAMLLAEVNVLAAASTITSGNIVDRRVFTVTIGGILPTASTALPTDPAPGQMVFYTDTTTLNYWTGTAWRGVGATELASRQTTTQLTGSGTSNVENVPLRISSLSLKAGRRYRCRLKGRVQSDAASQTLIVHVTIVSGAGPAVAGNNIVGVGDQYLVISGGPGGTTLSFDDPFTVASDGTYSFGVFVHKAAGAGNPIMYADATRIWFFSIEEIQT